MIALSFLLTLTCVSVWAAPDVAATPVAPPAQAPAAVPSAVPAAAPTAAPTAAAVAPIASARPAVPAPETLADLESVGPETWSKIRDPFSRPASRETVIQRTELERFPVDQYELMGIMSGPSRMRAMVRTPESKTIIVAENAKMGIRGGQVRKITSGALIVREKITNILGQDEDVDTILRIKPKIQGQ